MNNKNKETDIINLGCRLNIYVGEVIKKLTKKNHINNFTIINSCAVTNEAEKKVRYAIRKAKSSSIAGSRLVYVKEGLWVDGNSMEESNNSR